MNFSRNALLASFMVGQASAFTPAARRAFAPRVTNTAAALAQAMAAPTTPRSYSATSLHMANVQRLADPDKDLLDGVDIFIFDCDGVIWRVSVTAPIIHDYLPRV